MKAVYMKAVYMKAVYMKAVYMKALSVRLRQNEGSLHEGYMKAVYMFHKFNYMLKCMLSKTVEYYCH